MIKFVVKKANSYMCIKTEHLRFLDVCSYLAPGFSYAQYLKALEVEAKKFFGSMTGSLHLMYYNKLGFQNKKTFLAS